MLSKAAKFAGLCEGSALMLQLPRHGKTFVATINLGRRRLLISQSAGFQSDTKDFWRPTDTFGPAAVDMFVKRPKQERRVDRQCHGRSRVAGYGGEARKPAACAGMTL
jgi:hypothetical protein